jgi:RNA polymerase sigma-70 factor (ECF subfamily)
MDYDGATGSPMATHDFDLAACVERVRRQDENAARSLIEHVYPLVARLVQAHLPRRDDAEDLVQEVFMKMFARIDQFRGQVPFVHWVSRVAVSTCIDRLRAQKRRPVVRWSELSDEEQRMIESIAAQDAVSEGRRETLAWDVLQKLLEALAPAERMLVTLLELEQKSIAEVCAVTGWNSGVVRIRAFRARQRLKKLYLQLEQGDM